MKELFDKELRNHIRDTFDHYDDLRADDAWRDFKKKKDRKKRGLIFWYSLPSGIAAALAFIWLFNVLSTNDIEKKLAKTELAQNQTKDVFTTENSKSNKIPENNATIVSKSNPENKGNNKVNLSKQASVLDGKQYAYSTKGRIDEEETNVYSRPKLVVINTFEIKMPQLQTKFVSYDAPISLINTDKIKISNDNFLVGALSQDNEISKESINAYTQKALAKTDEKEHQKAKKSNFNLSLDANTYYNFTTAGVNNQLNMGVGILSEFRISKKLSINSGIALNKQSISYGGDDNISSRNAIYDKLAMADPNSLSSPNGAFASIPSTLETDARLIGFDIPINIKYDIKIGKANTFISTGISSYSVINERYTNELSVVNYSSFNNTSTSTLSSTETNPEGSFSYFNFARTINFSFGVLYPVNKKNSISVEPFLKYPLSGLGYEDLKIGAGGVSFKLNFGK